MEGHRQGLRIRKGRIRRVERRGFPPCECAAGEVGRHCDVRRCRRHPPRSSRRPLLVPDERGKKVYALLRETMRAAGKVGVGQVTIRTTHHLAAVVPSGEVLLMITMRYVNQIREHSEFEFPSTSAKSTGVTAKEWNSPAS